MIHLTKICACTVYWWKWTKATCMADFVGCQYPFRWWYYHDPWRWYRFNASPKDCTDTGKLKLENFLHFMLLMRTYRVVVICLYVCKSKAAVRLSSKQTFWEVQSVIHRCQYLSIFCVSTGVSGNVFVSLVNVAIYWDWFLNMFGKCNRCEQLHKQRSKTMVE